MITVEHAHLLIASATHPGMKGKSNEDRFSISAYRLSADDPTPSVLALIADGIGGHRAGEVAADLAVRSINKFVAESPIDQPELVLNQALNYANQVILDQSKASQTLAGMGTTCVCVWVIGDRLYAASVGDSRLYLQRGAEITRLTTDHTWIQEAISQGTLTPEQAKGHPNAHIIRRFLGSKNAINPDLRLRLEPAESDMQAEANQGLTLMPMDRLLMCTDGLTDLVKDAEILRILRNGPIETCLERLINLANQRGGHDNITIIAMEVPQVINSWYSGNGSKRMSRSAYRSPRSPANRWMIGLLLLAILMLVLLLVYTYLH